MVDVVEIRPLRDVPDIRIELRFSDRAVLGIGDQDVWSRGTKPGLALFVPTVDQIPRHTTSTGSDDLSPCDSCVVLTGHQMGSSNSGPRNPTSAPRMGGSI